MRVMKGLYALVIFWAEGRVKFHQWACLTKGTRKRQAGELRFKMLDALQTQHWGITQYLQREACCEAKEKSRTITNPRGLSRSHESGKERTTNRIICLDPVRSMCGES